MLEHRNVADLLDGQLLVRAESPVRADARGLLRKKGIRCDAKFGVILVDVDAILFVNDKQQAMTAWLHLEQGGLTRVWLEAGFAATRGYQVDPDPQT